MAKLTVLFIVVLMIAVVWSQHVDDVVTESEEIVTAGPSDVVPTRRPWTRRNRTRTRDEDDVDAANTDDGGDDADDDDDDNDDPVVPPSRRRKWKNRGRGASKSKRKKWRNRSRNEGEVEEDGDDARTTRRQWRQRNRNHTDSGEEQEVVTPGECRTRRCWRKKNATNVDRGQGNFTRPPCNVTDVGEGDETGGDAVQTPVQDGARGRGCGRWSRRQWKKWRKWNKRNQTTPQPMIDDDDDEQSIEQEVVMEE